MSAFGRLIVDVEEEISLGNLSFKQIAAKYSIPLDLVYEILDQYLIQMEEYYQQEAA
jgi:antitoxin component of RelBE/YafQ-DinJ toxin-antitoxin module